MRAIGAWPPVWRLSTRSPLDYAGLAADVLAAVQDGDHSIGTKQIKADGRKVWRASLRFGQTEVEVVVDQLTGIVTWCSRLEPGLAGHVRGHHRLERATAGRPDVLRPRAGRRARRGHARPHLHVSIVAHRRRRATGFAPLKSTLQPDGFTLRSVATRRRDDLEAAALGDAAKAARPVPSAARPNEVDQLFTRDLTWFTIAQTRIAGDAALATQASTLAGQSLAGQLSLQSEVLQYGAFTGSRAYTWYSPTGPALFVADKEFAVSVRGGITRDDLISLAEGLQPLK